MVILQSQQESISSPPNPTWRGFNPRALLYENKTQKMKKPKAIIFFPKKDYMTLEGRARPKYVYPMRNWRKQVRDWFQTVPGIERAQIQFNDDSMQVLKP
jgi:hypothetical protein